MKAKYCLLGVMSLCGLNASAQMQKPEETNFEKLPYLISVIRDGGDRKKATEARFSYHANGRMMTFDVYNGRGDGTFNRQDSVIKNTVLIREKGELLQFTKRADGQIVKFTGTPEVYDKKFLELGFEGRDSSILRESKPINPQEFEKIVEPFGFDPFHKPEYR